MRRSGLLLGAALFLSWPLLLRTARSWRWRVAVNGHSMEPTLRDGDWLLVDPAPRAWNPGDVVVLSDPRAPGRLLVKRVAGFSDEGSLRLAGDHPAHRDEAASIGNVEPTDVIGRAWLVYWPPGRIRRVG